MVTLLNELQVEKPFGRDLETSIDLKKKLAPNWSEDEIFRIDHYLGKVMVKNMLVLRFGNPMFGAVWDCNHIDNVQVSAFDIRLGSSKLNPHKITMTEAIGTEGRGGYFDDVGIIRDIMQNRKSMFFVFCIDELNRNRPYPNSRSHNNGTTRVVLSRGFTAGEGILAPGTLLIFILTLSYRLASSASYHL